METIILTSPVLLSLCGIAVALHIAEFFQGGNWWMSAINLIYHIVCIVVFVFFEATMTDLLIFLLLSTAVCLGLRLLRRKTK